MLKLTVNKQLDRYLDFIENIGSSEQDLRKGGVFKLSLKQISDLTSAFIHRLIRAGNIDKCHSYFILSNCEESGLDYDFIRKFEDTALGFMKNLELVDTWKSYIIDDGKKVSEEDLNTLAGHELLLFGTMDILDFYEFYEKPREVYIILENITDE
jgi:hypothetical protein